MARTLRLLSAASSSWVSPAARRCWRSREPKADGLMKEKGRGSGCGALKKRAPPRGREGQSRAGRVLGVAGGHQRGRGPGPLDAAAAVAAAVAGLAPDADLYATAAIAAAVAGLAPARVIDL